MSINRAMTVMNLATALERAATASVAKGAQVDLGSPNSHGYNPHSPHNLFADPHGAWTTIAEQVVDLIDAKIAEALQQGKDE